MTLSLILFERIWCYTGPLEQGAGGLNNQTHILAEMEAQSVYKKWMDYFAHPARSLEN